MAAELTIVYPSAGTLYAIIRCRTDGKVWSTVAGAWATWADGSIADYDVTMTSRGGDLWTGDLPSGIAAGVKYRAIYYEQAGASPATGDYVLGHADATVGATVDAGADTATYDLSTDIGKLRLEIGDTDVTPSTDAIFLDAELQIFLNRVNSSAVDTGMEAVAAAGYALMAIAADKARLGKMVRTLNFTKDTRTISRELMEQARMKFQMAGLPADGVPAAYAAVEWNVNAFTEDQIQANKSTRETA